MTSHAAEARRIVAEAAGLPPEDLAADRWLKAAHVHAMLAVADQLERIADRFDDVTSDDGPSIHTWADR